MSCVIGMVSKFNLYTRFSFSVDLPKSMAVTVNPSDDRIIRTAITVAKHDQIMLLLFHLRLFAFVL